MPFRLLNYLLSDIPLSIRILPTQIMCAQCISLKFIAKLYSMLKNDEKWPFLSGDQLQRGLRFVKLGFTILCSGLA